MDKISKQRIKELKKQKKYDEIFREFGQKEYLTKVPFKYRKADLKKLKKEGKYEDIFNKYGESEYNKILVKSRYNEIKEAKGTLKANLWRAKVAISKGLKKFAIGAPIVSTFATAILSIGAGKIIDENSEKYKAEIEEYNKKIEKYANEIKMNEYSDIQIFMKVMDDMWENIQGYGAPTKDIKGFWELDLATEDGIGVCRNMASDVARKLNKINPKYNARTMIVYMDNLEGFKMADIQQKIIQDDETVIDDENANEQESVDYTQYTGNHLVALVDVPDENLTLVLDPTNPALGIYINGEIIILNSEGDKKIEYDTKEICQAVIAEGGIESLINISNNYLKSFFPSELKFKEIEEKYGVEAQNKALREVRAKKVVDKAFDEKYKVELSNIEIPKLQYRVKNNFEIGERE